MKAKTDTGKVTVTVPGAQKYDVTVTTNLGSQIVAVEQDRSLAQRIDSSLALALWTSRRVDRRAGADVTRAPPS